jgi:phosphate butyryltransferase
MAMVLKSLDSLIDIAAHNKPRNIAVAAADDLHVLQAIQNASQKKIILPILVGKRETIFEISESIHFDISNIEIIDISDPVEASKIAVSLIQNKRAEILMKGMVSTAILLRAVLDKENGLSRAGLLSHFALNQLSSYPKLLAVTDAAMNIKPEFSEKVEILKNAVLVLNRLGYENPKVAVICPVETVNPKIESTVHASMLTLMNKRNQLLNCIVDGPLALDNAISIDAAHYKGIDSQVAGDADLLVVPDLDSGNILYKSINFLAGGTCAAIIVGASVPIVLTSRADSKQSKLYSIALAACM